jgi:hypothetical protein
VYVSGFLMYVSEVVLSRELIYLVHVTDQEHLASRITPLFA